MSIMTKPSGEARTAIAFITGGTLVAVWSAIWYSYLRNHSTPGDASYYFCAGFFLSGLVLVIIGFAIGRIGRSARQAELPPVDATPAVVNVDQTAAARAPVIANINPAQPVAAPTPSAPSAAIPALSTPTTVVTPSPPPARMMR